MICRECGHKNPLHISVCEKCGATVRNRVPNIDLGDTLLNLLHRPGYAFSGIFQSEKKNYALTLFILAGFRYVVLNYILLAFLFKTGFGFTSGVILNLVFTFSLTVISLIIVRAIFRAGGHIIRIKDLFSAFAYSSFPSIIFLILFLPLEVVMFGEFVFLFDPSPFLINPLFAYFFLSLEIIFLLWQILLFSISLNVINRKVILNYIVSLFIHLVVYSATFILFAFSVELNRRILSGI